MEISILKTLRQIAGVAGAGLGVLLILYRDLLRKDIFPKLGPAHAYRVIRLLLVLTWSIAFAGLAAWLYSSILAGGGARHAESVGVYGGKDRLPAQLPARTAVTNEVAEKDIHSLLVDPRPRPFGLVCRKFAIARYDQEYAAALSLLPGPTHDFREMFVYVRSLPNGVLYGHSNYITNGYEHPTKMATNDPSTDLEDIALNMVFDASPPTGAETRLR